MTKMSLAPSRSTCTTAMGRLAVGLWADPGSDTRFTTRARDESPPAAEVHGQSHRRGQEHQQAPTEQDGAAIGQASQMEKTIERCFTDSKATRRRRHRVREKPKRDQDEHVPGECRAED